MMYEYRCLGCGQTILHDFALDRVSGTPCCGRVGQRIWSVSFHRPMPPHFNHSVGRYVSNETKFSDALKEKAEEATAKTGIPHDYKPVDIRDRETLGVTEEGLDGKPIPGRKQRTFYTP